MKYLIKILSIFLLLACFSLLALPAAASSYAEHQGLQISVEMDKEKYDPGEPITATITVTNAGSETVTILNLEQLIPEGYVLAENSEVAMQNVDMQPGQTIVLQVTFVGGEPAESGDSEGGGSGFWNKLLYGETWGIPNLLLAVILVIAFVIFMLLT